MPVALGVRALRGGAVTVALALDGAKPRVVLSTFLATAADGDRLALEPYHVAVAMPRGPDGKASAEARAAVAEGRERQGKLATQGLEDVLHKLEEAGYGPAMAALLVNRAGWITDLLEHSLFAPEHPPVAEGLAVRDAFRLAFGRCGVAFAEVDEKSLPDTAARVLGLSPGALDAELKALGTSAGKPWRKEQKLACLSAWLALTPSYEARARA
jgi:hypothetical protein